MEVMYEYGSNTYMEVIFAKMQVHQWILDRSEKQNCFRIES